MTSFFFLPFSRHPRSSCTGIFAFWQQCVPDSSPVHLPQADSAAFRAPYTDSWEENWVLGVCVSSHMSTPRESGWHRDYQTVEWQSRKVKSLSWYSQFNSFLFFFFYLALIWKFINPICSFHCSFDAPLCIKPNNIFRWWRCPHIRCLCRLLPVVIFGSSALRPKSTHSSIFLSTIAHEERKKSQLPFKGTWKNSLQQQNWGVATDVVRPQSTKFCYLAVYRKICWLLV